MEVPPSIQNKDPFEKAVPGYSLTQAPGKWPWENPPQFADPDDAIDFIVEKLETPKAQDRYLKMMVAGISIEEIVASIAIGGFQQGYYNPDVAEIIKMPLAIYFMNMAEQNEIYVNVFATPDGGPMGMQDTGMDDNTILEIMARRNPMVFEETIRRYGPEFDAEGNETMEEPVVVAEVELDQGSFLDVEEGEV